MSDGGDGGGESSKIESGGSVGEETEAILESRAVRSEEHGVVTDDDRASERVDDGSVLCIDAPSAALGSSESVGPGVHDRFEELAVRLLESRVGVGGD